MVVSRKSQPTPEPLLLSKATPSERAAVQADPPSATPPSDRVRRARRLLQLGLLETPERLDAAIEKLIDAEFSS